jgi:NADH-quinone oxidoreductase subunit C
MTQETLQELITSYSPQATFDAAGPWLNVTVSSSDWLPLAEALRNHSQLEFDYLFCMTGVDWKTHLSVVYHLSSKTHGHSVVVKVKIDDRENPEVESVCGIWRTAEMHELEIFDLFGIKFRRHPGLRRLFMTDDWKGWPMRKDYEDPINMIKL